MPTGAAGLVRDDPLHASSMPARDDPCEMRRTTAIVCAMFDKVLIANRGAIACRIIRTLHGHGHRARSPCTRVPTPVPCMCAQADEALLHRRGAGRRELSRSATSILEAARQTGAQAIHPGYGFLSENAAFAEACAERGIAFIGPTPEQMRDFGLKHTARALARASGVPLLPGTGLLDDVDQALRRRPSAIGYPVMLKSTAGGGGIGMQLCRMPPTSWRRPSSRCAALGAATSPTPVSSWKSTSARAPHRGADLRRR